MKKTKGRETQMIAFKYYIKGVAVECKIGDGRKNKVDCCFDHLNVYLLKAIKKDINAVLKKRKDEEDS